METIASSDKINVDDAGIGRIGRRCLNKSGLRLELSFVPKTPDKILGYIRVRSINEPRSISFLRFRCQHKENY
jgi:hypothetical protein